MLFCLRVEVLARKVEEIAESNFMVQSSTSTATPKLPPALDERMTYLEDQVNSQIKITQPAVRLVRLFNLHLHEVKRKNNFSDYSAQRISLSGILHPIYWFKHIYSFTK